MNIRGLLRDDKAKLALASAVIQGANLLFLLLAKATIPDEDLAFVLANLAVAGIIGSIASMRLEVLVFQEEGQMTYAAAAMPLAAMAVVTVASLVGLTVTSSVWSDSLAISPLAVPMVVGLGMSTVQSFLFVQVNKIDLLLAMRVAQGVSLGIVIAVIAFGARTMSGPTVLFLIGMAYAAPSALFMVQFVRRLRPAQSTLPALYWPGRAMIKRSGSLTLSTGVNSLYVNLPLLAAAATQSDSFVTDFGLIRRCFSAPITLSFQTFGRLFLAGAINWSTLPGRTSSALTKMVTRTMAQSTGVLVVASPFLVGLLYVLREPFGFEHLGITPFLVLAAVGQSAVNPVAQVRIALRDEQPFLVFDVFRMAALAIGLYVGARLIPFEVAFGLVSAGLYGVYTAFIFARVSRHSGQYNV